MNLDGEIKEKKFKFVHLFFETTKEYSSRSLPNWIMHPSNKWFVDRYVMKLEIGQHIDTDFHRITRIE